MTSPTKTTSEMKQNPENKWHLPAIPLDFRSLFCASIHVGKTHIQSHLVVLCCFVQVFRECLVAFKREFLAYSPFLTRCQQEYESVIAFYERIAKRTEKMRERLKEIKLAGTVFLDFCMFCLPSFFHSMFRMLVNHSS
jgi:hypothetical protein